MNKEEFLKGVSPWCNHRHLLWEALELTKDSPYPVLEMGCGDGSTPFLQAYCKHNGRELVSIDSNKEWAAKFGAWYLPDWDKKQWFDNKRYSVVLVDEAPGEHRRETLKAFNLFPDKFEIIVIHDSEPNGWNASDYQVRELFHIFKYQSDWKEEKPLAWATWLSNEYPKP